MYAITRASKTRCTTHRYPRRGQVKNATQRPHDHGHGRPYPGSGGHQAGQSSVRHRARCQPERSGVRPAHAGQQARYDDPPHLPPSSPNRDHRRTRRLRPALAPTLALSPLAYRELTGAILIFLL